MQTVNVTDIQVKNGITESGPRAGQKWELIIIVGNDGSEFRSFDTKVKEVGIGGVMEIEPVVKDGRTNIKKFTITKKGQPVALSEASSNGEPPEKRQSIEDQTRAYIIADLFKAEKLEAGSSQVVSLLAWLDKLGTPESEKKAEAPTPKAEKEAAVSTPAEGEPWSRLENVGQLFTRAQSFGLSSRDVYESVGVVKPEEIIDLDEAWTATAKKFTKTIEAFQEATKT